MAINVEWAEGEKPSTEIYELLEELTPTIFDISKMIYGITPDKRSDVCVKVDFKTSNGERDYIWIKYEDDGKREIQLWNDEKSKFLGYVKIQPDNNSINKSGHEEETSQRTEDKKMFRLVKVEEKQQRSNHNFTVVDMKPLSSIDSRYDRLGSFLSLLKQNNATLTYSSIEIIHFCYWALEDWVCLFMRWTHFI